MTTPAPTPPAHWLSHLSPHCLGVVLLAGTAAAGTAWLVCEKTRVQPLAEAHTRLEKERDELVATLKEERAQAAPARQSLQQLNEQQRVLEAARQQWQTNAQAWQAHAGQLQAQLEGLQRQCGLQQQIAALEDEKRSTENRLRNAQVTGDNLLATEMRRQSGEYQARIVQLQDKLACTR